MTISVGSKLGPYEITSPIGAGGMGEVYRARDTRLDRNVAIKVLPESFAEDKERVRRFQREAKVLASLNHPHIAAIYDVETVDGAKDESTFYLVLEYIEGESLAERLKRGPLPVEEALNVGRQIAEALEAAHEKGVIHRDLKPGNVQLRPDGTVKVLDFGIAKALEEPRSKESLVRSPTGSIEVTQEGTLLGTASYMSPEQVRGEPVDRRTDIWAFGCVLYEALAGKKAFDGETPADAIAAVVKSEPDWSALPSATTRRLRVLMDRCLRKDSRRRLHDIADARLEIEEADPGDAAVAVRPTVRDRLGRLAVGLIAGLLLGLIVGRLWSGRDVTPNSEPRPVRRSTIDLPPNAPLPFRAIAPLRGFDSPTLALSPDGGRLVYVGSADDQTALYLREIDSFEVRRLPDTEGAHFPFFSPDGSWVGFLTSEKVKKVSLRGDSAISLCDARMPVRASWTRDDVIYFTEDAGYGLSRVDARDGKPSPVVVHLTSQIPAIRYTNFGEILPGKPWALVTIWERSMSGDYASVAALHLDTLEMRILIRRGYDARYVETGHLVFVRGASLLAVAFDLERMETSGESVGVVPGVSCESHFGQGQFAVCESGTLAYVPGIDVAVGTLAWVDREGEVESLGLPEQIFGVPAISPDGRKLAIEVADLEDFLRIYDLDTLEPRRFAIGGQPVWSPNVSSLTYSFLDEGDRWAIARQPLDHSQEREILFTWDNFIAPHSWSYDAGSLAISEFGARFRMGFLVYGEKPTYEAAEEPNTLFPTFSPDGNWVAYSSQETGRFETWVRSFPDGQTVRQISVDGGIEPVWRENGELFWRNGNRFWSTKVTTQPELDWELPRVVYETDFIDTHGKSYDVSPDGQRLLVVKESVEREVGKIRLVENWFQELKRLVPTDD